MFMFIPDYFKNDDLGAKLSLMQENPFAYFITPAEDRVMFTPLPAVVEETSGQVTIYAHMAAMNEHSNHIEGSLMTVVFMGPHHYISPRWYVDPRSVPTWNYALVIATGKTELLDRAGTFRLLKRLSDIFDPEWSALEKEKEGYYQKMISQIVAFSVKCTSLEGKFKLSQNHPVEDRKRVIAALEASDHDGRLLADLMKSIVL